MFLTLLCVACIGLVAAVPIDQSTTNSSAPFAKAAPFPRGTLIDFAEKVRQWGVKSNRQWKLESMGNIFQDLKFSTDRIKYGAKHPTISRNHTVFTGFYCNNQDIVITTTLQKAFPRQTQYSWNIESGLKVGKIDLSAGLEFPDDFKTARNSGFSRKIDLATVDGVYENEMDILSQSSPMEINPHKAVKIVWYTIEQEVEVPFEIDIRIEGVVYFKFEGQPMWPRPVSVMEFDGFEKAEPGMIFHATGVFRSVKSVNLAFKTTEMSLGQSYCVDEI